MRHSSKLAAVLLGTLGVAVSSPAWASVDRTVALSVASSGWSWNPPGAVPVPASSVGAAGDLLVGYAGDSGGAPSAETYLQLDLSAIPAGGSVASIPVMLTLDAAAHNVQPTNNALVACLTAGDFKPGEGTAAADQPKDDCSVSSTVVYNETAGTYSFDAAAFLDSWKQAGVANVVVRPPVGYTLQSQDSPFQVSFTAAKVAATAEVQLPDVVPPPPAGGGSSTPPLSSGGQSAGGFTSGPGLGSVSVPPPSGPVVAPAPAPQTAPVAQVPPAQAPAMSVASAADIRAALAGDNTPPSGFWLAGGLGAIILGLVSWAVGDTRSQVRVLRAGERRRAAARAALLARQQAGGAAPATPRRVRSTGARPAGRAGTAADLG